MATKTEVGRLVGRPVRRREDERMLRGQARYLDDVELPRLAHVAFVRSPHAHARIRGIRKPEGALLVLTAAELDGRAGPLPVMPVPGAELAPAPHPVLAADEVRYVGQPVAAVVAETRALAEDLAEQVEVDYEPLEPALDPRTAPEQLLSLELAGGDVDGAFAAADRVVSGSVPDPAPRRRADGDARRGRRARPGQRRPDRLGLRAGSAPSARRALLRARPAGRPDPRDRPRRRRRLRLEGRRRAGDLRHRGRRHDPRPAGQVGRGPRRELRRQLPGPRAGGGRRAGARRTTAACSACARGSSPTSAATSIPRRRSRRGRPLR